MRVALVPSAFHPWVGGVEELSLRLAHCLKDEGHEVEVWTARHPPDLAAVDTVDGVPVRRFRFDLPASTARSLVRLPVSATATVVSMVASARRFRPDVVHVQCFSGNGVYATVLSRIIRRPLVITLQGETVMDANDIYEVSTFLRAALRVALRRAAAVTACSAFVLADARTRFRLPVGGGVVIANGVDINGDADPAPVDVPFKSFILGLGRLVTKKGFDLLIDAFAASSLPRHVGLVIAGSGPVQAQLEHRARNLGVLDRVHFTGSVTRAAVAWLVAACELMVVPSRVEPFGIVVLEGARARKAVIVTARGGATEILDARACVVVDPFNTAALAKAVDRLFDDRELRERLGTAAREQAAEFDWRRIAGQYQDVYRTLVR